MTRTFAILMTVGLIACGGKDDDGKNNNNDDTGNNSDCANGIVETFPADGATDVYYRTVIDAVFQAEDPDAEIVVTGPDGDVAGDMNWEGTRLQFFPKQALDPSTDYDVTINYECGEPAVSWKTSAVGASTDASGLEGNTYVLDIASGRFVKPEGVGPLLQQQLTVDILIGVTSADATEIEMLGAIAEENSNPPTQDLCSETIDFPTAADFSDNPYFKVGPDTTTISVQGFDITIDDLEISGAFGPDGSFIAGAILAGAVDTRPLVGLIDEEGDDDTVCELVATFGVPCETCPDKTDYCLSLFVDSIAADLTTGTLETRTTADVEGDTNCD